MEDSLGHPVQVLGDTNHKLAELLAELKKLHVSETRDCVGHDVDNCGWQKLYYMLHESMMLLYSENEKLSDYAHNAWIKTKVGDIDAWAKEMADHFRMYRDEMMNEMMVYRDELRQKVTEPSAPLPRIKNRRYRNGR